MCLQLHFDPVGSEYCLGREFTVTVSINLSLTLDDNIILLVNDAECSVNDSDKNIVECVNDDSHLYSFILTATNIGTVIIEARTNYYGADWYSDGKQVIVTKGCAANSKRLRSYIGISQETVKVYIFKKLVNIFIKSVTNLMPLY